MIIRLLRTTISMRQDSVYSVYPGITLFLQNQILTPDGRSNLGKTEKKIHDINTTLFDLKQFCFRVISFIGCLFVSCLCQLTLNLYFEYELKFKFFI